MVTRWGEIKFDAMMPLLGEERNLPTNNHHQIRRLTGMQKIHRRHYSMIKRRRRMPVIFGAPVIMAWANVLGGYDISLNVRCPLENPQSSSRGIKEDEWSWA
jgi:hypothetical protein